MTQDELDEAKEDIMFKVDFIEDLLIVTGQFIEKKGLTDEFEAFVKERGL